MSVRIDTPHFVHTGTQRVFRVTTSEDTLNHSTEIFIVGADGAAVPIGEEDGVAAGAELEITCSFVDIDPGSYRMQIVNGRTTRAAPKVLWPDDDNEEIYLVVRPAEALSYVDP